jgi:RNA polymerase sigma-70 factor (ECF subfamily)
MTDQDIIERVKSGETAGYAELVRRHQSKVLGLCTSLLGHWTHAEDAAQDVFVKAFKTLSQFRGEAQFSTWIYRIAYRHCVDLLRSRTREKAVSWETLLEQRGESIHQLFAAPPPQGPSLENEDLIQRILSALKPEYREILILRESQGFTYEEIAHIMNCSLDSVKARLRRAREDVQDKMRHFCDPKTVQSSEVSYGK